MGTELVHVDILLQYDVTAETKKNSIYIQLGIPIDRVPTSE